MDERTDEQREESRRLHQASQEQFDKQQNALCFLVIGGILLIIGIIFIFLANRRRNNVLVGIDVHSLAFCIMLFGLVLGSAGVIYGGIKFLLAYKKQKEIIKQINQLK